MLIIDLLSVCNSIYRTRILLVWAIRAEFLSYIYCYVHVSGSIDWTTIFFFVLGCFVILREESQMTFQTWQTVTFAILGCVDDN